MDRPEKNQTPIHLVIDMELSAKNNQHTLCVHGKCAMNITPSIDEQVVKGRHATWSENMGSDYY